MGIKRVGKSMVRLWWRGDGPREGHAILVLAGKTTTMVVTYRFGEEKWAGDAGLRGGLLGKEERWARGRERPGGGVWVLFRKSFFFFKTVLAI
jgi:hypothetical protein